VIKIFKIKQIEIKRTGIKSERKTNRKIVLKYAREGTKIKEDRGNKKEKKMK
jgi:hypothetical protein